MQALQQCIQTIALVTRNGRSDLGLVIAMESDRVDSLTREMSAMQRVQGNVAVFALTAETTTAEALTAVADAAEQGTFFVVVLGTSFFDPVLYNLLKNFSDYGWFDFSLHPAGHVAGIVRPKNSFRCVVVTTNDILNQCNHPRFLSLFGPVVRI